MGTANAFDMLILPMFQWTAGILATFPLLHAARVGLGSLVGRPGRPEPRSTREPSRRGRAHRPSSGRAGRPHAVAAR